MLFVQCLIVDVKDVTTFILADANTPVTLKPQLVLIWKANCG